MTTPSGLPRAALQFWGAARGAAADRANTRDFYQALRDAGATIGGGEGGLSISDVTQLRSAAARVRNAAETLARAPEVNAIDASMIGAPPYGRDLASQAALPIYQVGITLHTFDFVEGVVSSDYRQVRFTGQLSLTKGELFDAVAQDAEALADTYGQVYTGHDVHEILAV